VNDTLILARAVHFAATILVAGEVFFVVAIAEPAFGRGRTGAAEFAALRIRFAWIAWISLVLAVVSGALWLVVTAGSMSGEPLADVLSQGVLWTVLSQTDFGNDWCTRFAIACTLAGLLAPLLRPRGRPSIAVKATAVILAAALAGSLAWAGHANGAEGLEGILHPAADVLHLIAAAAWVGGLLPLVLLLAMPGDDAASLAVARTATLRFSALGVVAVATLLFSGIVNTWYLVGSIDALTGTNYGQLLSIKISLFVVMVAIATVNRLWLTPRLVQDADATSAQDARRQLRRNAVVEIVIGAVIIGIVAVLGTLRPASHAQHHSTSGAVPADATFQHIHGVDGMADVLIEPGSVGMARASIHLMNDDLDTLPARGVTLTLTAPSPGSKPQTWTATADADGVWIVDAITLREAGNWAVDVNADLGNGQRLKLAAPIVIEAK
jgi:copper resistance protein D